MDGLEHCLRELGAPSWVMKAKWRLLFSETRALLGAMASYRDGDSETQPIDSSQPPRLLHPKGRRVLHPQRQQLARRSGIRLCPYLLNKSESACHQAKKVRIRKDVTLKPFYSQNPNTTLTYICGFVGIHEELPELFSFLERVV